MNELQQRMQPFLFPYRSSNIQAIARGTSSAKSLLYREIPTPCTPFSHVNTSNDSSKWYIAIHTAKIAVYSEELEPVANQYDVQEE